MFDLITIEKFLRLYFFGLLVVGWFSNLILAGVFDSFLLALGYVPVFENIVFAIITTWNGIVNPHQIIEGNARRDENNYKNKLRTEINTLKVLLLNLQTIKKIQQIFLVVISAIFIEDCLLTTYNLKVSIKVYHIYLYSEFFSFLCRVLYTPVTQWMKLFYKSIKDENYLIGTELQNSPEVSNFKIV